MVSNRRTLTPIKTEFLWLSAPRRKYLINHTPITLDSIDITPSTDTCLLGVLLDETLSFHSYISHLTQTQYYQLRRNSASLLYILRAAAT